MTNILNVLIPLRIRSVRTRYNMELVMVDFGS